MRRKIETRLSVPSVGTPAFSAGVPTALFLICLPARKLLQCRLLERGITDQYPVASLGQIPDMKFAGQIPAQNEKPLVFLPPYDKIKQRQTQSFVLQEGIHYE